MAWMLSHCTINSSYNESSVKMVHLWVELCFGNLQGWYCMGLSDVSFVIRRWAWGSEWMSECLPFLFWWSWQLTVFCKCATAHGAQSHWTIWVFTTLCWSISWRHTLKIKAHYLPVFNAALQRMSAKGVTTENIHCATQLPSLNLIGIRLLLHCCLFLFKCPLTVCIHWVFSEFS